MRLIEVVEASAAVAATSKRLVKTQMLADLLAAAGADDPGQLPALVGLLLASPRQGRLGVGWAGVAGAVGTANEATLTVHEVDELLDLLAATAGEGSQRRRQDLVAGLFARATAPEGAYLRGVLLGEIRHGALAGVLADASAKAFGVDAALLRRATMMAGDLGAAAVVAATEGDQGLAAVRLEPTRGVQPMLASSAPSVAEAMALVSPAGGAVSIEWKLDGARIQAHRHGSEVRIFTRNLNEIGQRLPQVADLIRSMDSDPLVLDGEVLGLDPDGQPRIFQETMSRFSADADGAATQLRPFFFDVLHADGVDLTARPLAERQVVLERVAAAWRAPALVTAEVAEAEEFGADALRRGHEGVMVKALDSTYDAGRRGSQWCKVKPVRTLDLVVLGAEWGHGRRQGWLSNLHLGARAADVDRRDGDAAPGAADSGATDSSTGFVMVGKTFKGLTDELLRWQTDALLARAVSRDRWAVMVRPELVVEIALDGVQISRRYPGGVALRFARVRGYRSDRDASTADTIDAVRALLPGVDTSK